MTTTPVIRPSKEVTQVVGWYREGAKAQRSGCGVINCPYSVGTDSRKWWLGGWWDQAEGKVQK